MCITTACLLTACAAPSSQFIVPKHTSSVAYESLECKQIKIDLNNVTERLSVASVAQDKKARRDEKLTAWYSIFIWPVWFFVLADDNEPYLVAELKGQQKALEHALLSKC